MSGHYLKRYPDPRARQRAEANYRWLAGLEPRRACPSSCQRQTAST